MTSENLNPQGKPDDAGAGLPLPHDPLLDPLLDEALAPDAGPGGVPAGLTERILARTQPLLARRSGALARIGPTRLSGALAALLALAATIGLVVRWSAPPRSGPGAPGAPGAPGLPDHVTSELSYLAYGGDDAFDREMALLASRVENARRPADWHSVLLIADELERELGRGDKGVVY